MGSKYIPWPELPPERREQVRAQHRRARKLREMGRPLTVDPKTAMAHVRRLHDEGGMTFAEIAAQAPPREGKSMASSTVSDLYRGHRRGRQINRIPRYTHERIMSVKMPALTQQTGAWVDATGTRRRLQALAAGGYGIDSLSEMMKLDRNMIWRIMVRPKDKSGRHVFRYVAVRTRETVNEWYGKLAGADPRDLGITAHSVGRAKGMANRHGWAPHTAWDEDTIDDPDAIAEWTGRCGTPEGYYLHLKYHLFVRYDSHKHKRVRCEPCVKARNEAEGRGSVRPGVFDEDIISRLRRGDRYREIAAEFGISTRTVQRIASDLKKTGWKPHPQGPRKKKED